MSAASMSQAQPEQAFGASRGESIASWLLRLAILSHAVALFATVYLMRQTQFGNLLFLELFDPRVGQTFIGFRLDDPYLAAVGVERITVALYLLAAIVVCFKPWWPLLLIMSGYALAESLSGAMFGGYRYREWTVYADMLRWGVPLALAILVMFPGLRSFAGVRRRMAVDLLRVLVAGVFITHGLKALYANPGFIDLIIGTFGQNLSVRVSESTAVAMLTVIAVVDFVVALAILVLPVPVAWPQKWWPAWPARGVMQRVVVPTLLLWLAFWGLVTALSRITSLGIPLGLEQFPELLVRASHFLAPLALLFLMPATFDRAAAPDSASASEADQAQAADHPSRTPQVAATHGDKDATVELHVH